MLKSFCGVAEARRSVESGGFGWPRRACLKKWARSKAPKIVFPQTVYCGVLS